MASGDSQLARCNQYLAEMGPTFIRTDLAAHRIRMIPNKGGLPDHLRSTAVQLDDLGLTADEVGKTIEEVIALADAGAQKDSIVEFQGRKYRVKKGKKGWVSSVKYTSPRTGTEDDEFYTITDMEGQRSIELTRAEARDMRSLFFMPERSPKTVAALFPQVFGNRPPTHEPAPLPEPAPIDGVPTIYSNADVKLDASEKFTVGKPNTSQAILHSAKLGVREPQYIEAKLTELHGDVPKAPWLLATLANDNEWVAKNSVPHAAVADALTNLMAMGGSQPSPVKVGEREFEISVKTSRGTEESPFDGTQHPVKELTVRNVSNGAVVHLTSLQIDMIRKFGFYGAPGTKGPAVLSCF